MAKVEEMIKIIQRKNFAMLRVDPIMIVKSSIGVYEVAATDADIGDWQQGLTPSSMGGGQYGMPLQLLSNCYQSKKAGLKRFLTFFKMIKGS